MAPLLLSKTDGFVLSKEESQLLEKMAEQYRKKKLDMKWRLKAASVFYGQAL